MTLEVVSLGCRLNISESEELRALLSASRNLVVINSCAVTSEAVRQTRQTIRRTRRNHPGARLLVTGCAAEVERDMIASMPEVDGLVPNHAKLDPRNWNVPAPTTRPKPRYSRAFVQVQNGCDHSCTFCIIPKGRGASRSLEVAEVLREVGRQVEAGTNEIVLTGVDITSWGADLEGTPSLGHLATQILAA
ncbi:MAG: radical SAM protein, partial [Sphingomonadaceae bacterium]|nr:radical SAM protein [Sphingomonadaceae bacterium]